MSESKSRSNSRPGSAPNNQKTMTVLNPKTQARPSSQKSKALTKKPLERAKIASSASSSAGFSYKTPVMPAIDPAEKRKIELLNSKPLDKLDFSSLSGKSAELSQYDKERERRFKEIQSFIDNLRDNRTQETQAEIDEIESEISQREAKEMQEELMEDDIDLSSIEITKSSYAGIEEKLVERERLIKTISSFTDYLKEKEDEEGNKIVEFPQNFQEIVEFAVEHSVSMKQLDESYTPEDINWLQVYDQKKNNTNPEHQKALAKIRALDRTLEEIERKHKQLKLQWSKEDLKDSISNEPVFITRVKSRKHSISQNSISKISRASLPDKILKNIETASSYKGHYSFIDRLASSEKVKLNRLLEEGKSALVRIEENTGIIPDESIERLSEIDDKLKRYVPESAWEEKSISGYYKGSDKLSSTHGPFSINSKHKKGKVKPADPALREERERREAQQKLAEINTNLVNLHNKTVEKPTEEELNKLMLNAMMSINESEVIHSYAILDERNSVLQEAKNLIERIERNAQSSSDEESIHELLDEAQRAIDRYEELSRNEKILIESSPEYIRYKQKLQAYLNICNDAQREVENAMDRLTHVERKLAQAQDAFSRSDYLELDSEPYTSSLAKHSEIYPDLNIEAIEQEMESKALESLEGPEIKFKVLEMLNPDNFPLLHDVLGNINPEEYHDFEADEEYQAMLKSYMNIPEDEESDVAGNNE